MIPRLHLPMLQPGDVVPHLGKGQLHWREGFSAHALATTWFRSNALPAPVRTLLDTHPHFAGAELVDAVLERQTSLEDGIRGHSQTDLLAIIGLGPALAVAAVEGKVEESFGPLIADWATTPIRAKRLAALATLLGADPRHLAPLRYQLFHRTAAAVFEARRYRAPTALMLVHSFSPRQTGWPDFKAFVEHIGLTPHAIPGTIIGPKPTGGTALYAAWLSDELP